MQNKFDELNEWVNSTEGSLVNFLTAFSPWLAPLAPAYMTFRHMIDFLHFPFLLALVLALLVEILGFGTVSTGLDFWFYNRKEKAGVKKAPLEIIIGIFIFYLGLILMSNVVIDISNAYLSEGWQKAAVILVRAGLTLQTIPGALIVAVRTGHRDLLREIKKEKEEKDAQKYGTSRTTSETNSGTFKNSISTSESTSRTGRPSIHQERVFSYLEEQYKTTGVVPTFTKVMEELELSQSTASRLRNEWIDQKQGK